MMDEIKVEFMSEIRCNIVVTVSLCN